MSVWGSQPMISEDKDYVIVFNGCINFREIKSYLENQNVKFHSSSDTEVLKIIFFGEMFLNYFDGMWSCYI